MKSAPTSLCVPRSVQEYVDLNFLSSESVVGANVIMRSYNVDAEKFPFLCLALGLVLTNPESGNSCIRVSDLLEWKAQVTDAEVNWPVSAEQWTQILLECPELVAPVTGSVTTPFVLDHDSLYAAKALADEELVARRLAKMLLDGRLQVITGGPGSGKTTSIAERLVQRMSDSSHSHESIELAAPTGLAAKRMKFALANALSNPTVAIGAPDEITSRISELSKGTVHRLLKYNPSGRRQYGLHAGKTLNVDLVVIDEVSMMPLSMMAKVLDALDDNASLILVGDKDQLASVESGSVLADICAASDAGPNFVEPMTGKYRFKDGSPVALLSNAINTGNTDELQRALVASFPTGIDDKGDELPKFSWVDPVDDQAGLSRVAREAIAHARELCERAKTAESDAEMRTLLAFRDSFQVVCAHKQGNLGVSGWNSTISRRLGELSKGQWHIGRPIMVLTNDYINDLSNGDIGVICADQSGARFAVFEGNDGIRRVAVSKLPPVDTVHALTIHKSQGSEYGHTVVVLPVRTSKIVTRELVYTGITRAKPHLTIVATQEALLEATMTPIRRATGLADRLLDQLKSDNHRWPFFTAAG